MEVTKKVVPLQSQFEKRVTKSSYEILAQKNDSSLEELAEKYRSRTENLQLVIRHASGTGVSRLDLSEIAWIGLSDGTDLTQMVREAAEKGTERKDTV